MTIGEARSRSPCARAVVCQKLAAARIQVTTLARKHALCLGHEIAVAGICPRQQEIDARVAGRGRGASQGDLLPTIGFRLVGNASKKSASCFRAGMRQHGCEAVGFGFEGNSCVKARPPVKRNTESTSPAREKPKPRILVTEETFLARNDVEEG